MPALYAATGQKSKEPENEIEERPSKNIREDDEEKNKRDHARATDLMF
jgi:hypothetical protein